MAIPLLPGDPHDDRLRANVRPPAWVNPTPAARYQLVVIGAGPAGLVAAAAAAGLGAKVALVERDLMGGDCLNVGCVPSKALLRAARAAAAVRRAKEFGVWAGEPEVEFAAVMERVRRVRAELSAVDSAERFRKLGVDVFLGEGKFLNEDTVGVNGATLRFGRCLIATGARPVVPDIPGLKESRWFTNETVFALTELPKRLLVIGGGPVGCELGQAFARLGSDVTVVAGERYLLPREDPDAGGGLYPSLEEDGVTIFLNRRIDFINGDSPPEAAGDPILARMTEGSRRSTFTTADTILAAVGRSPNVEGLDLGAAGIAFDPKDGIRVDDRLRSTNPRVFAAGDVCSLGYKFTHAADAMARLVVRNALFPLKGRASALTIPWCTYTDPEVGRVGLNDREAAERGVAVDLYRVELAEVDRAVTDGEAGFVKVLAAKGTDRIVGATVVGPHAGELVGTISLAMTHGIGLKKLANTIFPYPTYTEALRKIADQYNRTRFTPLAGRVLGTWLRWFR
jgi:pyruvate/2-oxoglutarate dehydrogenase complex dihydrolipoamide dehydrogenase (E3) component